MKKVLIMTILLLVSHGLLAAQEEIERCRHYATPQGWSDDIDAALDKAKAEGKELFVYFPLYCDKVWINGKEFSPLRAWTNPEATAKLAESYVLVFWPWDYGKLYRIIGKPKSRSEVRKVFDLLSPMWQKIHGYSRGATPRFLIVNADSSLVWSGVGATDMAEECEGEGLAFATKRIPILQEVLKRYYPVKQKIENLKDEEQVAKLLYGVLKDCDYKFACTYFREDVERMVKADKKGTLGIREKYPFYWLVWPLLTLRTDFWNARNDKIRQIQKENQKMSRKEAGFKATLAMREEWEPKCRKLLKAADKIMPKLVDEGDRGCLTWLKQEAEAHIKVWAGESTEIPGF